MPELPAFLADFLEPRFSTPVEVIECEDIAPQLRRVRFQAESLKTTLFVPGQIIEFRVSPRAFRHYTPAHVDPEQGTLDVLFYLHGMGPGSAWAAGLEPGVRVGLMGPGGKFFLQDAKTHVFLGDETTMGLFVWMAGAVVSEYCGAIEVFDYGLDWLGRIGLRMETLIRSEKRGETLVQWLEEASLPIEKGTYFYLAGHAQSISLLRKKLLSLGWGRKQIQTYPYWADGKKGL